MIQTPWFPISRIAEDDFVVGLHGLQIRLLAAASYRAT